MHMHKVIGLQEHVTEFRVTDTGIRPKPTFDGIFREHHIDGKIFANVAEKVDIRKRLHPVVVIDKDG